MPKYICFYIAVIVSVFFGIGGAYIGYRVTEAGTIELKKDIQRAEDRANSIGEKLGDAEYQLEELRESLDRTSEAFRGAERRNIILREQLERERAALESLASGIADSQESTGRIGILADEGQAIIVRLLSEMD